MPKYTVPKPKKNSNTHVEGVPFQERRPRIHNIPANDEIIKLLNVGEGAEVILQGKIVAVESRDNEHSDGPKASFDLEVHVVEAYNDKGAAKGKSKSSDEREIDELADA